MKFVAVVFSAVCIWLAVQYVSLPDVEGLKGCLTTSMHKVQLCPGGKSYVRLGEVAPILREVFLASEDSTFYSHEGFDWFELKKSLELNLFRGTFARGGSTISQQLVKNAFLDGEKSIVRKLKEALLTYRLEKMFSKNEIFERYLNVVELGPNVFGVKAASQYYFSKPPRDLNVLESAFLAYLLPNPKVYSRVFARKKLTPFARGRLSQLVQRMGRFRKLSQVQVVAAKQSIDLFPWTGLNVEDSNDQPFEQSCAGQICEDSGEEDQVGDVQEDIGVEDVQEEPSNWDNHVSEGQ
jgi:monofunctional glycosyltransferase